MVSPCGFGVQGLLLAVDVVRGDEAAVEEGGGGGDGLGDQAAGVAAKVEDEAGVGGLLDGGSYEIAGALGERVDRDDVDPARGVAHGHVLGGEAGPAQGLVPGPGAALQPQRHLRTGGRALGGLGAPVDRVAAE